MYVLWDLTFQQVLFQIAKKEDVISSSLKSVDLPLPSLLTEMNAVAPLKSCVESLPVRNKFKSTFVA